MNNENSIYDDGDTFSLGSKEKITFRDIILKHLAEIAKHSFVEFRGGFWQHKRDRAGGMSLTYVQDSGEAFSNAIDCMALMLYPHFDKPMTASYEELRLEVSKAIEAHTSTVKLGYLGVAIEKFYRSDQAPDEAHYVGDKVKSQQIKIMFRSVKLALKKRLFRDLCSFLYRKKYLNLGALND